MPVTAEFVKHQHFSGSRRQAGNRPTEIDQFFSQRHVDINREPSGIDIVN